MLRRGGRGLKLLTATSSDVYAQQLGAKRGPLFGDTPLYSNEYIYLHSSSFTRVLQTHKVTSSEMA